MMFRKIYQKYIAENIHKINEIFDEDQSKKIKNYKIINISWFDETNVNCIMGSDYYFKKNPHKRDVIFDMVHFILTDKNNYIYNSNYICNEKEQICMYNDFINTLKKSEKNKYKNLKNHLNIAWIKLVE